MDSSVPIVHLGFLEKPRNKLCTKALYFPSFIGGEPAFICKEKFIPDMTVCQRCNSRMTFIGQIYCPIDENPEAFHRMIYIYACLKGKCQASSEAVRVFRCQLPQANNYFNKQSPNYSLLDMTDKQLEAKMKDVVEAIMQKDSQYEIACKIQHQSKKLSSVYLIEIDTESEKLTKNILKKLKLIEKGEEDLDAYDSDDSQILTSKDQELIDKFNQEEDKIDPNEEGDVINKYIKNEGIAEADVEKAKELLTNFDEEKDETIDDLAKEFDKQNDENLNKEFEVFLEATKENSSQVIRYCRKDMLPLWSSKKNKLSRTDVPECEYCGSKRAYELQLMPAIYNYVNELVNLSWNSVVIYTCENSCTPKDFEYQEEFAFVELPDDNASQKINFEKSEAILDVGKKIKKEKVETDKKGVKKEGPTKPGLDEETEDKIKKQLEELQLDFD